MHLPCMKRLYKGTCICKVQTLVHQLLQKENIKELRKLSPLKLGVGNKTISNSLDIPQSSGKSIVKKWKKYGSCLNLPRAGHPRKQSDWGRKTPVMEATRCPL